MQSVSNLTDSFKMGDVGYSWRNCSLGCPNENDTSFYYYGINDTYNDYFYVDVDVTYWQVCYNFNIEIQINVSFSCK